MNGDSSNGQRSRLRAAPIFVAAHLAAVSLIYGTALSVGGGFASPPFPPDLPFESRRPPLPHATAGIAEHRLTVVPEVMAPGSSDVEPPWHFDAEGRARFIPR